MRFVVAAAVALIFAACVGLLGMHIHDIATCRDRGGIVAQQVVMAPQWIGNQVYILPQAQAICVGATQ